MCDNSEWVEIAALGVRKQRVSRIDGEIGHGIGMMSPSHLWESNVIPQVTGDTPCINTRLPPSGGKLIPHSFPTMPDETSNGVRETSFVMVQGKKANRAFRAKLPALHRQDASLSDSTPTSHCPTHANPQAGCAQCHKP